MTNSSSFSSFSVFQGAWPTFSHRRQLVRRRGQFNEEQINKLEDLSQEDLLSRDLRFNKKNQI